MRALFDMTPNMEGPKETKRRVIATAAQSILLYRAPYIYVPCTGRCRWTGRGTVDDEMYPYTPPAQGEEAKVRAEEKTNDGKREFAKLKTVYPDPGHKHMGGGKYGDVGQSHVQGRRGY